MFIAGASFPVARASAPDSPAASAHPEEAAQPKAEEILADFAKFYQGLQSFQVHVKSTMEDRNPAPMGGLHVINQASGFLYAMTRPNRIALRSEAGDRSGSFLVSDGRTTTVYSSGARKFTSYPAPPQLAPLTNLQDTLPVIGSDSFTPRTLIIPDIVRALPHESLCHVGEEIIDGQAAHHLHCSRNPSSSIDLWIAAAGKPLLLKATTSSSFTGKGDSTPNISVLTDLFTGWETDQPIPSETFAAHLPADAVQVPFLVTVVDTPEPSSPLLNHPAPDFTLSDPDGHSVSLASLKGKIVVLDFGLSRNSLYSKTLPFISRTALALKDQGVVFYAMDGGEKTDEVRTFLHDNGFSMPVLCDPNGVTSNLYTAPPHRTQIFLIDRQGIVRAVYSYYRAATGPQFSEALKALIAGKNLPPPPPSLPVEASSQEEKALTQVLPPGKTPGTFTLTYSGAIPPTGEPVFPVTARITTVIGNQDFPTVQVPEAKPFTLSADLAPGSYWVRTEVSPPKQSIYSGNIVARVFIDEKGNATITPNGPVGSGFDRIITVLAPAQESIVMESRPVLKWEAIPGAVRYSVGAFALEPNRSERVFSTMGSLPATEYRFPVDVLPNRKYEWDVWAYDADQHSIGRANGYFYTPGGKELFIDAKTDEPQALIGVQCHGVEKGYRVQMIIPGSPALKAGLHPDDIITQLNGQSALDFKSWEEFAHAIHQLPIGQPASFVFIRDGVEKKAQIAPVAKL